MDHLISQLYDWGGILFPKPGETGSFWKVHSKIPGLKPAPLYFNMRGHEATKSGTLPPEAFDIIGAAMANHYFSQPEAMLSPIIAGVPNAADPLATAVIKSQTERHLKQLWLYKEEFGSDRRITSIARGQFQPGDEVVLFENVVSLGFSAEEAIAVLRSAGLIIRHVVTFIDMELGGRERLKQIGCDLFSMFTTWEVLHNLIVDYPEIDSGVLSRWGKFREDVQRVVV